MTKKYLNEKLERKNKINKTRIRANQNKMNIKINRG